MPHHRLYLSGSFQLRLVVSSLLCSLAVSATRGQIPAVGLHSGGDFTLEQYEAFGAWLGRDVMYRVVFLDMRSWADLANASVISVSKSWVNSKPGRVEVISVPMLPEGENGNFSAVTTGARDDVFRAIATRIANAQIADRVILRLGWEGNGSWYPWSYQQDPAGFRAAFRHIVSLIRATAPGVRFDFNISNLASRGTTGARWTDGYPGDDVIDVISMDIYDHFNPWEKMLNGDAGLNELRTFAKARGKPEAYAEWACSVTSNGHGDNAGFIRAMAAWMAARPGKVLYQAYWNTTDGVGAHLLGTTQALLSESAATYRLKFGPNTEPRISGLADQELNAGATTGAMTFAIGDDQTPPELLRLSVNASNQNLVPLSNIVIGGSGANRTITVTPAPGRSGWSTIWVKVSDAEASQVTSFVVNVRGPQPNTPPVISKINGRTLDLNASTGPLDFSVSDAEMAATNLVVSVNVSNPALLPLANVKLAGTGTSRTLTLTPAFNKTGWSTVWLKVSDGELTRESSFVVQVSVALQFQDIGTTLVAGSQVQNGSVSKMQASGYDIYNRRDEFNFGSSLFSGNVELTVRVAALSPTHPWTKAGLMLRSSRSDNAAFVGVFVTPAQGIVLQWRPADGASSASSRTVPGAAPRWLRLSRVGDSIYAFCSGDGVNWEFVEAVDVDLPDSIWGGTALVSHSPHDLATAVFDGFAVD